MIWNCMKLYEIDMEMICNYMKTIWKLYEIDIQ